MSDPTPEQTQAAIAWVHEHLAGRPAAPTPAEWRDIWDQAIQAVTGEA